jgi:SpoVK/Ycf46/Vps4 family AAA+-type ATPase
MSGVTAGRNADGAWAPFAANDEALEAARRMFRVRSDLDNLESDFNADPERVRTLDRESKELTVSWHRALSVTPKEQALAGRCRSLRLNRLEREILAALVLEKLALVKRSVSEFGEMLDFLCVPDHRVMAALRAMSEEGRLYRAGLIEYDDPDEDICSRTLVIDPAFVEEMLLGRGGVGPGWPVKSEEELYDRMAGLTRLMSKQSGEVEHMLRGFGSQADVFKVSRLLDRQLRDLRRTLDAHSSWKIAEVIAGYQLDFFPHRAMLIMLLALLGKELGHLDADDDLFQGGGLVRAASKKCDSVRGLFQLLAGDGPLVGDGLIRPCGGPGSHVEDGPEGLLEVEFELTPAMRKALGVERRGVRRRRGQDLVRTPVMSLDRLVLRPTVRRALRMAVTHAREASTLVRDWGLGEAVPYGRTVTLLFSGPPGVGKTASAEALAHELGRPILPVDYSEVQNCYVGNTEKNIVRMFREAAAREAVLFWDEADAMFYDRDAAARTWEVRDVNVLLQELERFEGVCVLATNRRVSLDPALERRITLKVAFEPPDREERLAIWQRMIPAKLPLGHDVDLDVLTAAELTGGEIKNVLLNAARLALGRGPEGPVTMADFGEALRMEKAGSRRGDRSGGIGFRACAAPLRRSSSRS